MRPFILSLKSAFKNSVGLIFFSALRCAERRLPNRSLYLLLKPVFFSRAFAHNLFKRPKFRSNLPDFLQCSNLRVRIRQRADHYLNHVVQFFPDRLAGAKWEKNFQIDGIHHLQEARQRGRPVILAFCHFGPYYLLRPLLRAAGFPAATFVGGKSETRSRFKQLQDRLSPRPEIPVILHHDQLRETIQFLTAGHPLLVALDAPTEKQTDVPFCDGWTFQMATGAMRLAVRHQAELIPCTIIDEGFWHFRIQLKPPVPKNFLAAETDLFHAGTYLMKEMFPDFQARPEQCTADLIRCLKPNPAAAKQMKE